MPSFTCKCKATQAGTATPDSTISRDAVFQVTELLEQILGHLSWGDLYLCQRVCRRFNELISDSKILHRKILHFLPSSDEPASLDEPVNRLDHSLLCGRSYSSMITYANDFGLTEGQRIAPFLEAWPTYFRWKNACGRQPSYIPFTFKIASGQRWDQSGSWRVVFLTDPPVKEAYVRMLWNIKDAGAFRFNGTVRGEEGLTFGKLLDLVLAESSGAWTFIGFTHQLGSANKKILDVPGDTPGETIRRLERRLGGKAELQGEKSYVMFNSVS